MQVGIVKRTKKIRVDDGTPNREAPPIQYTSGAVV